MKATTQLNNITSEQNDNEPTNLIKVRQGGSDLWNLHGEKYLGYRFGTTGYMDDKAVAEKIYEVAKEFALNLAKNRVVCLSAQWDRTNSTVGNLLKGVEPVYKEDGLMQQLKNELIAENRDDIIWADYSWYDEKVTKSLILRRPSVSRRYFREIWAIQNKLDIPLADRMEKCSMEGNASIGIDIFPESEVNHLESDKKTVAHYVHSKNFIIQIGTGTDRAEIYIRINPWYITYDEIFAIIKPIFEKHGFEFVSTENPFIKDFNCEARCNDCNSRCMYNLNKDKYIYDRLNVDERLNPISYEKWCKQNKKSEISSVE